MAHPEHPPDLSRSVAHPSVASMPRCLSITSSSSVDLPFGPANPMRTSSQRRQKVPNRDVSSSSYIPSRVKLTKYQPVQVNGSASSF